MSSNRSALSRIEVVPASPEHILVLENLLELYIHDFSEFLNIELGDDGRFGYPGLSLYWTEAGRRPFLVRVDGKLAGFVLIKRESEIWDMAEFFVVRGYRRRGWGTEIAHRVWRLLPGWWQVRVMQSNRPALHFWERAIAAFTSEPVQPALVDRNGQSWRVFSFESPGEMSPENSR